MRVTQIQVLKVLFLKLLLQADCAVLQFAGWRQFGRHLQPDCAVLQFHEQRQFGRHLQLQFGARYVHHVHYKFPKFPLNSLVA